MKMYYVAHKFGGDNYNIGRAAKITRNLQLKYPSHVFICPLTAFSHINYGELGYDKEMELCLSLLSRCDSLLLTSEISKGMSIEIDYAIAHSIPIVDLKLTRGAIA